MYGMMEVPDDAEAIREDLRIANDILEEGYHPVIQGYADMLELALDLERRKQDEDAV